MCIGKALVLQEASVNKVTLASWRQKNTKMTIAMHVWDYNDLLQQQPGPSKSSTLQAGKPSTHPPKNTVRDFCFRSNRDCEDSSGEQYGIVSHQTYQKEKQLLETWLATKPSGAGQIKRDLKDIQGPDLLSELVDTVLLFVWSFCFALFCFIAG